MTAVDAARTLSLPEAVAATGTSESTIRRRLRERAFPGAVRDPREGWRLPVNDLRAAGFTVAGPLVEVPTSAPPRSAVVDGDQDAAQVDGDDSVARRDALRRARRRRAAAAQRDREVVDLRGRADRAEALAAARVDELADLPRLRQENADLRERVGRAEATAEAREVEVERLLHVVDRLTRAVGGAPDSDGPRVVPAILDVQDAPDAHRAAGAESTDGPVEDAPEPVAPEPDDVQHAPHRAGLLMRLLRRR